MSAPSSFDGASLLPHSGRARFVSEVLEAGDDAVVCAGRIPSESPFVRNGRVPGFVLVELAAQAAAIEALGRIGGEHDHPSVGYLVRARELRWTVRGVAAESRLLVRACREDSIPPLYTYRATVTSDGVEMLCGTFSIYVVVAD